MDEEESRIHEVDDSWQGNHYSSVISGNGDTVETLLTATGHVIPRTMTLRENGAGDMTASATRNMIWRARANNYHFPPTMPCLRLMKSFLIMVAAIIMLNLSVTLALGWATQYSLTQNSLHSDVKETIRRGNMAIKYIHALNEDLKSRVCKQPSAMKARIAKLNEAFGDLSEKIRKIMTEDSDEYQVHLL
ncbi:Hypothetical protein NTJ_00676 [Nesidiocoris tenuis]|uniref:Uncharacterized protein n=1 Tax=Nesidiocoris tenuis TaxID=355587 RepID=A0ABN7AAK3_9HEMI|nr:Hypothetical protein NTJ_00676 [Nesidiocoris tenuis]